MKLLQTLRTIIVEDYDYLGTYKSEDGSDVMIVSNQHFRTAQDVKSEFRRAENVEVMDSFEDIKQIAFREANKILDKPCDKKNKKCGLLVRDYMLGLDYQFWLKRKKMTGELVMTLNTSIIHPKKLFNKEKHVMIVIDKYGGYTIVESVNSIIINGKVIQIITFD